MKRKLPRRTIDDVVSVFDESSFFQALQNDIQLAKQRIRLQSPYVSRRRLEQLLPGLSEARQRGVTVCTYLVAPDGWSQRHQHGLPPESVARLNEFQNLAAALVQLGAHVTLKQKAHEKLVTIDDRILWDGSLNSFSHRDTSERMTRWNDRLHTTAAIVKHRLDACAHCLTLAADMKFCREQAAINIEELAQKLGVQRQSYSLSQSCVAKHIGVSQSLLSKFELGKRNLSCLSLFQLCGMLGHDVVLVPRTLRPAIEQFINERLQTAKDPIKS